MLENVIRFLFRCPHRRLTLPRTPASKTGGPSGQPYVVCLDCGGEFAYDWEEMRMGARIEPPAESGAVGRGRIVRRLRRT